MIWKYLYLTYKTKISFIGNSQPKKKVNLYIAHFHNFDQFCELGTVPNSARVQSQWEIEITKIKFCM